MSLHSVRQRLFHLVFLAAVTLASACADGARPVTGPGVGPAVTSGVRSAQPAFAIERTVEITVRGVRHTATRTIHLRPGGRESSAESGPPAVPRGSLLDLALRAPLPRLSARGSGRRAGEAWIDRRSKRGGTDVMEERGVGDAPAHEVRVIRNGRLVYRRTQVWRRASGAYELLRQEVEMDGYREVLTVVRPLHLPSRGSPFRGARPGGAAQSLTATHSTAGYCPTVAECDRLRREAEDEDVDVALALLAMAAACPIGVAIPIPEPMDLACTAAFALWVSEQAEAYDAWREYELTCKITCVQLPPIIIVGVGGTGGTGSTGGPGAGQLCSYQEWEISYDGGVTWEYYGTFWTCFDYAE